MTEDTNTEMLRLIIAQWPDLERVVAIWPFHGSGKLPPPETLDGLIRPYGLGHYLLALGQAGVMNSALHSDQEWEALANGLGQQLQRARIAKGLSQEHVAYRAKLSRYTY